MLNGTVFACANLSHFFTEIKAKSLCKHGRFFSPLNTVVSLTLDSAVRSKSPRYSRSNIYFGFSFVVSSQSMLVNFLY